MTYRLLFCLVLSVALVGLLLSPAKSRGAQATDDCQLCLSDCSTERQLCVENGNPPAACFAAWKECVDNCEATACQ